MLLKLPLLETWTIFQNLKGIKLICFLFAVVSKAIVNLKSYLEVLLLLEIICSFQDERIIVDLPESLWRTVLSRVQLRKKSTNSQNPALRVKKHPYFLSQTMFAWYLNFSGLIQTGLWCASASSLFFFFVWKNKVYSRKKTEKNSISGPIILYLSTWKSKEQIGNTGTLKSMTSAYHLPHHCRALKAFGSFNFGRSGGMYVAHRLSLSLLHFKKIKNQPRSFLAAKTSVNAEVK